MPDTRHLMPVKKRVIGSKPTLPELKQQGFDIDGISNPRFDLSKVKGQDELVNFFRRQTRVFNKPHLSDAFKSFCGKQDYQKYYLLEGPTGSGKTYIAEAFAGSLKNSYFLVVSASTLKNSQYINSTQMNLERLFAKIRKYTSAGYTMVVLIDEIDSFLTQKSNNTDQAVNREDNDIINRFLTFLDGAAGKPDKLFLFGTTNRYDYLDKTVVRPGRFEKVSVNYPDRHGVQTILKYYLTSAFNRAGFLYRTEFEDKLIESFINQSPVLIKTAIEKTYEQIVLDYLIEYDDEQSTLCFTSWMLKREEEFIDKWFLGIYKLQSTPVLLEKH